MNSSLDMTALRYTQALAVSFEWFEALKETCTLIGIARHFVQSRRDHAV